MVTAHVLLTAWVVVLVPAAGVTFVVFCIFGLFATSVRDRLLASQQGVAWIGRSLATASGGLTAKLAFEKA